MLLIFSFREVHSLTWVANSSPEAKYLWQILYVTALTTETRVMDPSNVGGRNPALELNQVLFNLVGEARSEKNWPRANFLKALQKSMRGPQKMLIYVRFWDIERFVKHVNTREQANRVVSERGCIFLDGQVHVIDEKYNEPQVEAYHSQYYAFKHDFQTRNKVADEVRELLQTVEKSSKVHFTGTKMLILDVHQRLRKKNITKENRLAAIKELAVLTAPVTSDDAFDILALMVDMRDKLAGHQIQGEEAYYARDCDRLKRFLERLDRPFVPDLRFKPKKIRMAIRKSSRFEKEAQKLYEEFSDEEVATEKIQMAQVIANKRTDKEMNMKRFRHVVSRSIKEAVFSPISPRQRQASYEPVESYFVKRPNVHAFSDFEVNFRKRGNRKSRDKATSRREIRLALIMSGAGQEYIRPVNGQQSAKERRTTPHEGTPMIERRRNRSMKVDRSMRSEMARHDRSPPSRPEDKRDDYKNVLLAVPPEPRILSRGQATVSLTPSVPLEPWSPREVSDSSTEPDILLMPMQGLPIVLSWITTYGDNPQARVLPLTHVPFAHQDWLAGKIDKVQVAPAHLSILALIKRYLCSFCNTESPYDVIESRLTMFGGSEYPQDRLRHQSLKKYTLWRLTVKNPTCSIGPIDFRPPGHRCNARTYDECHADVVFEKLHVLPKKFSTCVISTKHDRVYTNVPWRSVNNHVYRNPMLGWATIFTLSHSRMTREKGSNRPEANNVSAAEALCYLAWHCHDLSRSYPFLPETPSLN